VEALTLAASRLTLYQLFQKRATTQAKAVALTDGDTTYTYVELHQRVCKLAGALQALGLRRGERVAVLSENRLEYIELELAAAHLGLIIACLNWRLADDELTHCIHLVSPALLIAAPRYQATVARLNHGVPQCMQLGPVFEQWREQATPIAPPADVVPEDGLVILYTSGTTGMPKGALISQRAMVARMQAFALDYGITGRDGYIAWSPLFHMAATDHALATLMLGGKVTVHDGLDVPRLCKVLAHEPIGWLVAMPGMIELLIDGLKTLKPRIQSLRVVGAMADLVPPHQIAELTQLIGAPYMNSFGSTETGLPPASGALLPIGVAPSSLSKRESSLCHIRLVDAQDQDVPNEVPGELVISGPTLFSGYWNADATNAQDFRGGGFHMGDLFVRHADGSLDFVDRLKYLIKSGGENIYPAEIERVLLAHPAVRDAAVVRKRDTQWGEVPVAFVASDDASLDAAALMEWCGTRLSRYKQPKDIRFVAESALPRSSTGKIQRHEIEKKWQLL
jgi:acyl-CoA synthetase (AMP-forming)/AMP-acid ligase II